MCASVSLEAEQGAGETLVVNEECVVLRSAGDVVPVGGETDKVLLVDVALEGAHAAALLVLQVPHLELAVGGRADDGARVQELDVRDGLAVPSEERQGGLGVAQVVVVDAVVGRPVGQVVGARWIELDAADVGLGLQRGHRVVDVGRPQLDPGVVRTGRQQLRVHTVEIDAPTSLFMLLYVDGKKIINPRAKKFLLLSSLGYLKDPVLLADGGVPQDDAPFIVGGGEAALAEGVPGDAADLGAAGHLHAGVVDIDGVTEHHGVLVHLDAPGDAGDGEVVGVLVKLDGRHDAGVAKQVGGEAQRGQGQDGVVPREPGQHVIREALVSSGGVADCF